MARPRVPRVAAIAAVIARTVGLTISVVLLGNISYEAANWASQGKIYWLSFLAVAVAMIVDGWEIVGLMDYTRKVPRVHGGCLICEDILILCVAGPSIILILLSDLERDGSYGGYPWEAADFRTLILTFAVL
ncbi:hypothetical protein BX600DRAFT_471954 [Xylariales sp. PMI_506]|nr:hypothetical protein BX600DRAFT_471954 [Xylariales sp. PMI_506]